MICKTLRKYSVSSYQGSLKMLSNRLDSTRIERLVPAKVDPSHRKSICETLRKYSASNYQGSLKILSNRTTRHSRSRPVIPEVDLQNTSKVFRKWPRKGGWRCCRTIVKIPLFYVCKYQTKDNNNNNNNNNSFIYIALVSSAQGALQSYKIIRY